MTSKHIAVAIYLVIVAGSLFMGIERQGFLPWATLLMGLIGIATLVLFRQQRTLFALSAISLSVIFSWAGAVYFVYSTWESGEVVDIQLAPHVSIRTWIVEKDNTEAVVYDCPPEHLALLSENPLVTVERNGTTYQANLRAVAVSGDSEEFNQVYALYEEKYSTQSLGTTAYYILIGPRRGSVLHILYLSRHN